MGRFKKDTPPDRVAFAQAFSDEVWDMAVMLIARESLHSASCTDKDCGGIIYPWLVEHMSEPMQAAAFLAIVLERLADMTSELATLGEPDVREQIAELFKRRA